MRWGAAPVAVLALAVAGCGSLPASDRGPGVDAKPLSSAASPSSPPPYSREAFGTSWAIVHGQCDTREVVLERDAGPNAVDTDGDGCKDDAPVLDPYTGRLVDPAHADADHVYPLKLAWVNGAWRWTPAQRRAFYNDTANLRAVGASINRSKAELSPSQWRPPARSGWCFYAQTFESTAHRWQLPISPADQAAVNDMLTTCPH